MCSFYSAGNVNLPQKLDQLVASLVLCIVQDFSLLLHGQQNKLQYHFQVLPLSLYYRVTKLEFVRPPPPSDNLLASHAYRTE